MALFVHYDLISSAKRDDGLIDRSEFQTALGFTAKESLYVDRIFQLFDANGDSFISFPEFLQSVSVLSAKGSTDEKIRCTFGFAGKCGSEYLTNAIIWQSRSTFWTRTVTARFLGPSC